MQAPCLHLPTYVNVTYCPVTYGAVTPFLGGTMLSHKWPDGPTDTRPSGLVSSGIRLAVVTVAILASGLAAHASGATHPHPRPSGLYTIHEEYGAQEDLLACPGTPGRVVTYTALPNGAADVSCRISDIPRR